MNKILFWTPRVLSLAFALFIAVFALDVFNEYSGWAIALPLFMHLLPSIVLVLVTLVAWRYDLVGAIAFIGFALFYVWGAGLDRPWSWYALIAAPAAVVGLLYIGCWWAKQKSLGHA